MLQARRLPGLACSLASECGQPSGLPAGSLCGRGALPARQKQSICSCTAVEWPFGRVNIASHKTEAICCCCLHRQQQSCCDRVVAGSKTVSQCGGCASSALGRWWVAINQRLGSSGCCTVGCLTLNFMAIVLWFGILHLARSHLCRCLTQMVGRLANPNYSGRWRAYSRQKV